MLTADQTGYGNVTVDGGSRVGAKATAGGSATVGGGVKL